MIPRRTVSQLCNFPLLKGKMHTIWYSGHSREDRCDLLETIAVNLHYLFSMLYCSDYFFIHRETIKKSKNNQRFFAKGRTDPLALQMLPLWRREKCSQDCVWNIWGNNTNVLTCCTESALCRSGMMITAQTWHHPKSTACLKVSFTALFGSVETRKEMVTWMFLHCIVYRIHREIFGFIFG